MAIGQKLEEARNRKGISIREASESTKIRGDYLSAFESNNFEIKLPEVYLRGFVRLYARFLDIDQDAILVDLDLELGANSGKNLRKSLGSITSKDGLENNEYAKGIPSNKIKRGGNVQSTFTKPIIIISSSLLTLVIIVSVLTYSFSGDDNSNSPSVASPQNIKESVKSDINIDQAKAIITNEYSLRLAAIGPIQMLIIDDEGEGSPRDFKNVSEGWEFELKITKSFRCYCSNLENLRFAVDNGKEKGIDGKGAGNFSWKPN